MSSEAGERIYRHVRETRPQMVLELGTAHGVSAAYIAAGLRDNGMGRLTTVDHGGAALDPSPEQVLQQAGVADLVDVVREHSCYTWWLRDRIRARSDQAGNCEPCYDFVYLDGAHNFTVDGLAMVLIERLLMPGGWLLLDDMDWTYTDNPWIAPELDEHGHARPFGPLSDEERVAPQVRAAFETVVMAHPSFTQFRDDGWWAWAQKAPGQPRRYSLQTSRPLHALVVLKLRQWRIRKR